VYGLGLLRLPKVWLPMPRVCFACSLTVSVSVFSLYFILSLNPATHPPTHPHPFALSLSPSHPPRTISSNFTDIPWGNCDMMWITLII
jgi:hypothetical protein